MSAKTILGIMDGHNASAALMRDGAVVAMLQEERLTKVKNQTGFPLMAINELVRDHLGGDFGRIDHVALATRQTDPFLTALDHYSDFSVCDWIDEMHRYWKPYFYGDRASVENYWKDRIESKTGLNRNHNFDFGFLLQMPRAQAFDHHNEVVRLEAAKRLCGIEAPVSKIKHHLAHAYYALYGAALSEDEFKNAVILTADSWGDGENWSAWTTNGSGTLDFVASGPDHTVARIYKFVTLILGMKPNEHEYKVMGLSAYSKPSRYVSAVEDIFREALDFSDGKFVRARELRDSYFDLQARLEGHRFDNIAAGLQSWATSVTVKWAQYWLRRTGRSVLCFSGGLSMNIKLNGELLSIPEMRLLSVPASGADETLAAGACFALAAQEGQGVRALDDVYLGGEPTAEAWDSRLAGTGRDRDAFAVIEGVGAREAAKLLANDVILARCTGRAEFGARALGNRSILADPRDAAKIAHINDSVKNRDFWMPFTPSILAEFASDYLSNPKNVRSPHMTIGFQTNPARARDIVAALHPADRSARPQMVIKSTNPEYWELIDCFRELTNVPALLNTSLNLHGEPMNYTLADAVRTVALSDLPCVLGPSGELICKVEAVGDINRILTQ